MATTTKNQGFSLGSTGQQTGLDSDDHQSDSTFNVLRKQHEEQMSSSGSSSFNAARGASVSSVDTSQSAWFAGAALGAVMATSGAIYAAQDIERGGRGSNWISEVVTSTEAGQDLSNQMGHTIGSSINSANSKGLSNSSLDSFGNPADSLKEGFKTFGSTHGITAGSSISNNSQHGHSSNHSANMQTQQGHSSSQSVTMLQSQEASHGFAPDLNLPSGRGGGAGVSGSHNMGGSSVSNSTSHSVSHGHSVGHTVNQAGVHAGVSQSESNQASMSANHSVNTSQQNTHGHSVGVAHSEGSSSSENRSFSSQDSISQGRSFSHSSSDGQGNQHSHSTSEVLNADGLVAGIRETDSATTYLPNGQTFTKSESVSKDESGNVLSIASAESAVSTINGVTYSSGFTINKDSDGHTVSFTQNTGSSYTNQNGYQDISSHTTVYDANGSKIASSDDHKVIADNGQVLESRGSTSVIGADGTSHSEGHAMSSGAAAISALGAVRGLELSEGLSQSNSSQHSASHGISHDLHISEGSGSGVSHSASMQQSQEASHGLKPDLSVPEGSGMASIAAAASALGATRGMDSILNEAGFKASESQSDSSSSIQSSHSSNLGGSGSSETILEGSSLANTPTPTDLKSLVSDYLSANGLSEEGAKLGAEAIVGLGEYQGSSNFAIVPQEHADSFALLTGDMALEIEATGLNSAINNQTLEDLKANGVPAEQLDMLKEALGSQNLGGRSDLEIINELGVQQVQGVTSPEVASLIAEGAETAKDQINQKLDGSGVSIDSIDALVALDSLANSSQDQSNLVMSDTGKVIGAFSPEDTDTLNQLMQDTNLVSVDANSLAKDLDSQLGTGLADIRESNNDLSFPDRGSRDSANETVSEGSESSAGVSTASAGMDMGGGGM